MDTKVKEMLHHGDAQKQFVARERKEALLAVADYQRQLAAVQSSLASARTRDDSERALRECILKEEDLKWAKHKLDMCAPIAVDPLATWGCDLDSPT